MRTLQEAGVRELTIRKPSWRSGVHELVTAGDEVLGVLDFSKTSGAGEAEAGDGRWRFERPRGLAQKRFRVLRASDDAELTVVERAGWGRRAHVTLGGGDYELAASGFLRPSWVWTDAAGRELAKVCRGGGEKGTVTLSEAALASEDASLLALLGVQIALLGARDDSTAAGTAAAPTAVVTT